MLKIMAARVTAFGNIAVEEGSQSLCADAHDRPFTIVVILKRINNSVDWYARASVIAAIIYIDRSIYMQIFV